MPRKSFPKHSALAETAEDYANNSTVHGLCYTFDRSLFKVDRALWVLVCLTFAVLAVHLTYQSYDNWQQNQVVITLKNTAKPVNEISFPAVTICSTGLHMDIVEKILGETFRIGEMIRLETLPKIWPSTWLRFSKYQTKQLTLWTYLTPWWPAM